MTNEYYHDQEAATAHLAGVGLTFAGFLDWMYDKWRPENVDREDGIVYSASFLRQYIREHNTLNEEA